MANAHLNLARKRKRDRFLTLRYEVEEELNYDVYKKQFKDKIIYCNCDTTGSEFYKYFVDNFEELGLKCLIATGIQADWRDIAGVDDGTWGVKYFGKDKEAVWLRDEDYYKKVSKK